MSSDAPWTIGRLLQWTTEYFKQHASSSPRLDAEVLLASARGCQRIELYTTYDEVAPDDLRDRFRELVRRRAAGEPVAYLVGCREFYSLPFEVTRDVLIPRPETELLVVSVLDAAKQAAEPATCRIADVGTGSGIIAICLAKHLLQCEVTAIDVSPDALQVARRNAAALGVGDQIEFCEGDLLEQLAAGPTFDFVVSNPPYVSRAEWEELSREIKEYEPPQALLGGEDGTDVIRRLVPQAAQRLRPGGMLYLEISPMIEQQVSRLLAVDPAFSDATVLKDLAHVPRVVAAMRLPVKDGISEAAR